MTGFEGGRLARAAQSAAVVPSEDMQNIEDVHLMRCHVMMPVFYNRLHVPVVHED